MPDYLVHQFGYEAVQRQVSELLRQKLENGGWADALQGLMVNPTSHPAYPIYSQMCDHVGIPPAFNREDSWGLILNLMYKKFFFDKKLTGPKTAGWVVGDYPFPQAEFDQLRDMATRHEVMLPPVSQRNTTRFALWSGGFGMSVMARKAKLYTLESTPLGLVLDGMSGEQLIIPAFTVNGREDRWSCNGILWNAISAAYVRAVAGSGCPNMTVYMRSYTAGAVLFTQEQVNWRCAKDNETIQSTLFTFKVNPRLYLEREDGFLFMPFTGTDDNLIAVSDEPFRNAWDAASALLEVYESEKRALDAHLRNFEDGAAQVDVLEVALQNFEKVYRRGYTETHASVSADYFKMRVIEETQQLYQLANPSWHI